MPQARSLSHLEAIFDDENIKEAVRKLKSAHERGRSGRSISLAKKEVRLVQKAYRRAMNETEARTYILVTSFQGEYWSPDDVKNAITLEGLCYFRTHNKLIIVVEDMTRERITTLLSTSDEELTDRITKEHKELQKCKFHDAPVEIDKSFLIHTPYDIVKTILSSGDTTFKEVYPQIRELGKERVLGITSRIKSPGDLADKITDKILEIEKECRLDRIPDADDEVSDLSGIRFITTHEDMCYAVSDYLRMREKSSRGDFVIIQTKDYIKKPKENGYRALHLIVAYLGIRHEIQIMDTRMYDFQEFDPKAKHKTYRDALREAREDRREEWRGLNMPLRRLFGAKPILMPY